MNSQSKTIQLTRGLSATVDIEEFEFLNHFKWYAHDNRGYGFYAVRHGENKQLIFMHSLLIYCSPNMHTDHIDGNGLNNQKSNLRIVTHQQNQWNRRRNKNCRSKYKGVHWNSGRNKWQVDCGGGYFGLYDDENEAALAYNKKAKELYGEYAKLNEVN